MSRDTAKDALDKAFQAIETGDSDAAAEAVRLFEQQWMEQTGYPVGATLEQQKAIDAQHAAEALDEARRLHAAGEPFNPNHVFWEHRGHNRDLPWYAFHIIAERLIDPADAADYAAQAWTLPEFPEQLGTEAWRQIWRHVGYTTDDDDHPTPPAGAITVYRGSTVRGKRGMAWTGDLQRAQWFAARFTHLGPTHVWQATVGADRIYARFIGRGEDEWVINTHRLTIKEWRPNVIRDP